MEKISNIVFLIGAIALAAAVVFDWISSVGKYELHKYFANRDGIFVAWKMILLNAALIVPGILLIKLFSDTPIFNIAGGALMLFAAGLRVHHGRRNLKFKKVR